ncbi:hypothetical protein [Horticoccus sp. 23ND18S-11]|uniref:hypothetical protein n=1 Tax=Horticoccus sp. 23ND18S-11 TaxID=3391832 RepID=UPI0039C9E455
MRAFFLLLFAGAGLLCAQTPPYEVFPAAEPPYYRVRYEASTSPGELTFPVNYTIWIPAGVKTLRGVVVHQHGCGEGSCKSGLTGAYDLHWQALARKHGCALLSPAYEQPDKAPCALWCDPRNGSDRAFQKALQELGAKSGHPELARVPWALWGHSGGGTWVGSMTLVHPERVAAVWMRSGAPSAFSIRDATLGVPMMCNLGTKEGVTVKDERFGGVWPHLERLFTELRGKGALIGVAVDPLTSHECGNQRYLAIPWFDACLTARLPESLGEPLRKMPDKLAFLAPLYLNAGTLVAPVAAAQFTGARERSIWLPNENVARAWARYVTDTQVPDATPPPAPRNVQVRENIVTWEADADLESGLAQFVIERDGEPLATVPERAVNRYGRPVFQNLQYSDTPTQPLIAMRFTDASAAPGKTYRYRVYTVNTAGLKSVE